MKLQNRILVGPFPESVMLGPAVRFGGRLCIGGQQYNFEPDERAWIESRLIFHRSRNYKGYWAMYDAPMRACAANLSIAGGAYHSISGLIDTVAVPAGARLEASWLLRFGDSVTGVLGWDSSLKDAEDGTLIDSQFPTGNSTTQARTAITLPALPNGSYLWHVRLRAASKTYVWPPPDYEAITGLKFDDPRYRWQSPVYGEVYCNPFFRVGMVPNAPHPLRALWDSVAATGQAQKVPAWAALAVFLDGAGEIEKTGGEYASLRVIVGSGTPDGDGPDFDGARWIGDADVPESATAAGAALWTAPSNGGQATPWILDPTARIGGAFYEEPDEGRLWVGMHVAGRDGRTVRLVAVDENQVAQMATQGARVLNPTLFGGARYCECALSNEAPNSIIRYPDLTLDQGGQIHALTFCSRLRLRPNNPPELRLEETHPGGRSLTLVPGSGGGLLMYATESDFAASALYPLAFNYTLGLGPRGPFVAASTSHHIFDTLAAFGSGAYFVEEEVLPVGTLRHQQPPAQSAENVQYLTRFDGGRGQRLARWKVGRYDMGLLVAAGPNLVITGETSGVPGVSMRPLALRFTGDTIQRADDWPFWVRRMQPSLSHDGRRQVAIGTGYREDSQQAGVPLPGMYVFETTGEPTGSVVFTCSDPGMTGQPCPCVCVPSTVLFDAGYEVSDLPPFLVWDAGTDCWRGADSCAPSWAAPDAPCLQLTIGDGVVCYCLETGAWPYRTGVYTGIELNDPAACWPPMSGPPVVPCDSVSSCYNSFPQGSKIHMIELAIDGARVIGPLAAVLVAGAAPDAAPQVQAMQALGAAWPGWLWMGSDGDLPAGFPNGQTPTPEILAQMDAVFTQPARVMRENRLWKPARRVVRLLAIIAPNVEVVVGLSPR